MTVSASETTYGIRTIYKYVYLVIPILSLGNRRHRPKLTQNSTDLNNNKSSVISCFVRSCDVHCCFNLVLSSSFYYCQQLSTVISEEWMIYDMIWPSGPNWDNERRYISKRSGVRMRQTSKSANERLARWEAHLRRVGWSVSRMWSVGWWLIVDDRWFTGPLDVLSIHPCRRCCV